MSGRVVRSILSETWVWGRSVDLRIQKLRDTDHDYVIIFSENIALGRSYNQSSTLNNNVTQYGAGLGVDGRATTDAHSIPRTCAHTSNETDPTWTLNLNTSRTEKIQHIRLYLRDDCEYIEIWTNYSNIKRYKDMMIGYLVELRMCYHKCSEQMQNHTGSSRQWAISPTQALQTLTD